MKNILHGLKKIPCRWMLFALLLLFSVKTDAQDKKRDNLKPSLSAVFQSPPQSTKPYVFWYWVSNNISKDGIRKDLEAMAKIGIGGVTIAQVGYRDSPVGNVTLFSNQWWDCFAFALQEASRLGIKVNLGNSPGWNSTGGPWVKPEQAMRYLDVHEYHVTGPQKLVMTFPSYQSTERIRQSSLSFEYEIDKSKFKFQPVAVQAYPVPKGGNEVISFKGSQISSNPQIDGIEKMFDGNEGTKASIYQLPTTIDITTSEPFTARSLEIVPADISTSFFCRLEYLNNSGQWQKILSRKINRGETRIISSGFLPFAPVASAFPAISATHFRIIFTRTDQKPDASNQPTAVSKEGFGRIAEIRLSNAAVISDYPEKELGNKAPIDKNAQNKIAADETDYAIKASHVIDLNPMIDSKGTLTWNVPPGEWVIQHAGMMQTGVQLHPLPQNAENGFAADVMNQSSIKASFDSYIGQILARISPENRKTLSGIFMDSYEAGTANWTDDLAQKFKAAYHYNPMPWLPVLKGHMVESRDQSERFLWDLRRLIADLIPENYAKALAEKSKESGLKLWQEPYGGHGFPGEFFNYGKFADVPEGEFWVADRPTGDWGSCRAATSIANVYGRNIVSAESFTSSSDYLYKAMPRDFKPLGDWAFAQGINHLTFHVFVHQPDDKKPGLNTWYGSDFNRNNNWFQDAKNYVDYIKRCSALLQRGRRQTDIAVYIGDNVPNDRPALPYPLPDGYDLDFINYDALINLAKVENNRLVLPSGVSYQLLVLPPDSAIRPQLLARLAQFVKAGLAVYGTRPMRSSSLQGYPQCDSIVRTLGAELWGKINGVTAFYHNYGKGQVGYGTSVEEFCDRIGLTPDLVLPHDMVYTHRREDNTDIYFIANPKKESNKVQLSFRITDKQPEYWDPLTGEHRKLTNYTTKNGRVIIPVEFSPSGSCFIVFNKTREALKIKQTDFPEFEKTQVISGDWNVQFAGWGIESFTCSFKDLTDLSTSNDSKLKYFCGKATYTNSFTFNGNPVQPCFINLGRVESLAKVRLNGHEIGTLWCYPYRSDISPYLKKGSNKLEIVILNQWWNRLVGDEQPGAVPTTNVSARLFWKANDKLIPSGLIGPVTLEIVKH